MKSWVFCLYLLFVALIVVGNILLLWVVIHFVVKHW